MNYERTVSQISYLNCPACNEVICETTLILKMNKIEVEDTMKYVQWQCHGVQNLNQNINTHTSTNDVINFPRHEIETHPWAAITQAREELKTFKMQSKLCPRRKKILYCTLHVNH